MSSPDPAEPTESCPGCGAVLLPGPDDRPGHPGASPSCARLFEVTLRGLREDVGADPAAAAAVRLADDAYAAQHKAPGAPPEAERPRRWRTTIADVAADLDVIDLPSLIESWARAVRDDWAAAATDRSARSWS